VFSDADQVLLSAQEYKTRTQQLNAETAEAEAAAAAEAKAVAEAAGETGEEQGTQQADEKTIEKEDHLPIARVKRIIKCVFSPRNDAALPPHNPALPSVCSRRRVCSRCSGNARAPRTTSSTLICVCASVAACSLPPH